MSKAQSVKYIAVGPMCYGIAPEPEAAVRLMKRNEPYKKRGRRTPYKLFRCHADTTVSTFDGSLSYPLPHAPELVREVKPSGK